MDSSDTQNNNTSKSSAPKEESTKEVIGGYIFQYLVFGLPGLIFQTVRRQLNANQKERIVDSLIDTVLPAKSKK